MVCADPLKLPVKIREASAKFLAPGEVSEKKVSWYIPGAFAVVRGLPHPLPRSVNLGRISRASEGKEVIRTIVKRDGSKEEFSPEKINRWSQWAGEHLSNDVDWPSIVFETVSSLPEECTSVFLQQRLIKSCLDRNTWSYNKMAGRLYAALLIKQVHGGAYPSVLELHRSLQEKGLMEMLPYSEEEYSAIESLIDHSLNLNAAHFELDTVVNKYSIQDKVAGVVYETQQFVYMREAMALAASSPDKEKLKDVKAWYTYLSQKKLNAPTPNHINLGTPHRGFASCNVYTVDDTAPSLAIGDHIAYTMTYMSAGIGSHLQTRSLGDPVRGGQVIHQGKLPYYRAMVGAVRANLQAGRGGACTTYYNAFDPEAPSIAVLKNPMTPEDKRIRGMDYSFGANKFFARKAAKNEDIFVFNKHTAPDLYAALYSENEQEFERLYEKYEKSRKFKKAYVSARELLLTALNEAYETGRHYLHWISEMNRHTPFKEPIYSSNLCSEIQLPTKPYRHMLDLYSEELHERGEVALCSLAGINVDNITSEREYEDVAYYALKMIDRTIHMGEYPLPHIGATAKARLNAGVGVLGLAHLMAKKRQSYSTPEGKQFIHSVAERHAYYLAKASLRLGKELGNAPWIHKTKWPEGWLPIDTYNKNVDSVVSHTLKYDWETLRTEIVANGGIRNSALVAIMPSESSSKASGTTNSIYPIRELALLKTDKSSTTYWCAPEGERLAKWYESAWSIPPEDMIDCYAIFQKFTDQGISGDLFRKIGPGERVTSSEMLKLYFYMTKMGMKTRYYQNSHTSGKQEEAQEAVGCEGGACTL